MIQKAQNSGSRIEWQDLKRNILTRRIISIYSRYDYTWMKLSPVQFDFNCRFYVDLLRKINVLDRTVIVRKWETQVWKPNRKQFTILMLNLIVNFSVSQTAQLKNFAIRLSRYHFHSREFQKNNLRKLWKFTRKEYF